MKSMILSMLIAIALSNPDTNVIHENIPRLIKNNREILSVSECPTLNDECQVSMDGTTFEKYKCYGSELLRKQYFHPPCDGTNKKSGWQSVGEHENPCCLFQCSPETVKSIGICIPNGVQPLSPYDPNESEMVDAFSFKYCNLDGSGEFRSYIYGCGAEGIVVASSIKYPDECCPQPSCDAADFGKCIYNEETGRSEKYYCGSDGELILSTWQGTECSDPTKIAGSSPVYDLSNREIQGFIDHFEINLSCCPQPSPSVVNQKGNVDDCESKCLRIQFTGYRCGEENLYPNMCYAKCDGFNESNCYSI